MRIPSGATTNPSIFLRLSEQDHRPREVAWDEFNARYVPIISSFARKLGGMNQDVDDVVQDALLGFYLKSPTFVYDPSKGRFRRYLKICTYHALQKRFGKSHRVMGKPLDEVDPESIAIEKIWSDVWEQELLRRAIAEVRKTAGDTKTFVAFERYVIQELPAERVASELGIHIKSVYRAKDTITGQLRARLAEMHDDD